MALSAPLLTRKKKLMVALETAKGAQVAGTSAILAYDLKIDSTAAFIERKGTGHVLGQMHTGVIGARTGSCSFSVDVRSAGSAALDVGLAILIQACGFKQSTQVYDVHSSFADQETISIDVFEDGKKMSLFGAMGKVTFEGEVGQKMMANFEFIGTWAVPTDVALPATMPGTGLPMIVAGGTFTLGGESIKIGKYSLDTGNNVIMRADVDGISGIAHHMITDYDPVISIDPEADLVAGYDYYGIWLAGTTAAISLQITDGTYTVTFSTPRVQTKELKEGDREGISIYDFTGMCLHDVDSGTGALTAEAITITAA